MPKKIIKKKKLPEKPRKLVAEFFSDRFRIYGDEGISHAQLAHMIIHLIHKIGHETIVEEVI